MGNNKDFKVMTAVGTSITLILSVMGVIFVGIKAGIIIMITGVLILVINYIFTKRRYSEIEKLNSYLEKVLSGDYAPEILDQKDRKRPVMCLAGSRSEPLIGLRLRHTVLQLLPQDPELLETRPDPAAACKAPSIQLCDPEDRAPEA